MHEPDQRSALRYWDENLDPQNLGAPAGDRDLEREWAFYASDEQRFAQSRMPPLRGAVCLEIGGGLGTHALWLARQGASAVALDISARRLQTLARVARQLGLAERIHGVQAVAEALPFPADRFDLAYTKAVLIHTRLPEALREARRVLKPGGRAIFTEPQDRNPLARLCRRFFAPQAWKAMTCYFDKEEAAEVERVFPGAEKRAFFLFGFAAFLWQFKWPRLRLFRLSLALARLIDRPLLALAAPLRRYAWFQVFVGTKTQKDS